MEGENKIVVTVVVDVCDARTAPLVTGAGLTDAGGYSLIFETRGGPARKGARAGPCTRAFGFGEGEREKEG